MKLAFLGLGVMGAPMARHLIEKGHDVTVFNRNTKKASDWVAAHGGQFRANPKEAAQGCHVVLICVGNDDDVRSVVFGEHGALAGMQPQAVLVDHTTASATLARELNIAVSAHDVGFIDAPVSGGQAGAENGALTVMCGGSADVFDRVSPVLQTYAKSVRLMGEAGAGQLTKMVNQICIAGLVQGLAEGINFGKQSGLDMSAVLDVISLGAAGSWQMSNRGNSMNEGRFDFGFAVDWMRKDLAICLQEARANGSNLPVTALIDQFYADVQRAGGNRWDTSSLITRLQN
jgi:3-hydroxyisobutyrate dehydrogenase